jgi:PleD family two-component response regulator
MALTEMTQAAISAHHVQLEPAELRYLIVDDNRFDRTVIINSLMALGARNTIETKNALGAIRILGDGDIHMVLVSYDLPNMNGVELTHRIRRCDDLPNPEIPIIMISSNTNHAAVIEARNAGVHEFLAKPFSPESLYIRIHTTISKPRPFIREDGYVGPDRRWLNKSGPGGKDRRKR